LGGPHGTVAVCDFSLDHAGPQLSLRAVVGGLDLAGIVYPCGGGRLAVTSVLEIASLRVAR
jgi:hypothetical protein